jgi:cell division protein FtsB
MTLQDILADIHALTEDVKVYEKKYGILSETFYQVYASGAEPEDSAWVLDWSDWAGAYQVLLRRQEQYRRAIQTLQQQAQSLTQVIEKTARHEPIPVSA